MANFAALTSVVADGIFSSVATTVEADCAEADGAEGADMVCRSSGKGIRNFYAFTLAVVVNRISDWCVFRISLKNSYASLI